MSSSPGKTNSRKKRADYALIPSVQYILLVDVEERRVELDRREGEDWIRETLTDEGELDLPRLDVTLDMDDIYAG